MSHMKHFDIHVHFNLDDAEKIEVFVKTCRENETIAAMSGGLRYGGHDYLPNEQVLAVFQGGGEQWKKWNDRMWPSYVAAQFKIDKGETGSKCTCGQGLCNKLKEPYVDDKGAYQEIGHWVNTDSATNRPIMDTCLAALQMMVYYRYLPTFKQVDVPKEVVTEPQDKGDIVVDTDL